MKVAAIDIGTNTTRLLIIDSVSMKVLEKVRTITRLGENFNGILQDNAKARVLKTLENYKNIMKKHSVNLYRAVATSVIRESANGKKFVEEVYDKLRLKIDIISGKEEAELTFLGVLSVLDKNIENFLLLDIGGGSNEYSLAKNRTLIKSISEKFGVVFLYEKFIHHDPPKNSEIKNASTEISKFLTQIKNKFSASLPKQLYFVGTAGTITTLSAIYQNLKIYKPELINNHKIPKSFINKLLNEMLLMTNFERFEKYNIEKGREDVILIGLLIVKHTMETFGFNEIISIDASLLEGVAFDLLKHKNK